MKKYQSSYVFKQIKKKRICEENPYGFSIFDTRCIFDKCVTSNLDLHVLFFILDWSCYKNLPKQFSTENCRKESAHKVAKTKRYKDTFKESFKDFNIPTQF